MCSYMQGIESLGRKTARKRKETELSDASCSADPHLFFAVVGCTLLGSLGLQLSQKSLVGPVQSTPLLSAGQPAQGAQGHGQSAFE